MPRGGLFRNLAKVAEKGIAEAKKAAKEQGLQQFSSMVQSAGVPIPTGAVQQVQQVAQQVQTVATNTGVTAVVSQGVAVVQSTEQQAAQQVQAIATTTGISTVVSQGVDTVTSFEQQTQQQIQTIANDTGISNVVSQGVSDVRSLDQEAQQQFQSIEQQTQQQIQQAQQQLQSLTTNNGVSSDNGTTSPGDSSGQAQPDNSNNNSSGQDVSQELHDSYKIGRAVYNIVGKDEKPQQSSTITVAEVEPTSPMSPVLDVCSGQSAIREGYCTASMPAMNVCSSCYRNYISTSLFASSFKRVEYLPGSVNVCDMAVKAVRDVWANVCTIAAHQQGALLQQLAQQVGKITAQPTGYARPVQVVQPNMNITRKQVQSKQPITQVVELLGAANSLVNLVNGQ